MYTSPAKIKVVSNGQQTRRAGKRERGKGEDTLTSLDDELLLGIEEFDMGLVRKLLLLLLLLLFTLLLAAAAATAAMACCC